jgi:hypothetical protein
MSRFSTCGLQMTHQLSYTYHVHYIERIGWASIVDSYTWHAGSPLTFRLQPTGKMYSWKLQKLIWLVLPNTCKPAITHSSFGYKNTQNILVAIENLGKLLQIGKIQGSENPLLVVNFWCVDFGVTLPAMPAWTSSFNMFLKLDVSTLNILIFYEILANEMFDLAQSLSNINLRLVRYKYTWIELSNLYYARCGMDGVPFRPILNISNKCFRRVHCIAGEGPMWSKYKDQNSNRTCRPYNSCNYYVLKFMPLAVGQECSHLNNWRPRSANKRGTKQVTPGEIPSYFFTEFSGKNTHLHWWAAWSLKWQAQRCRSPVAGVCVRLHHTQLMET